MPALPVNRLPLPQAITGFVIINVTLLIGCALCWNNLLFPNSFKSLPFVLLCTGLWFPCWALLGFGQISAWPFFGFTGWLWCTKHRKYLPAGLFLVLTIIKPHTGLLPGIFAGVYALRQRQWSTLAALALGLLAATAAVTWFRPPIWAEYFAAIRTGTSPTQFYTATLDGWLRAHFNESFRYLTWPLWFGSLGLTALIAWKGFAPGKVISQGNESPENDPLIGWSVLVCLATVVFIPYGYSHDFVFLLPGFFLAFKLWINDRPNGKTAILIWIMLEIGLSAAHLNKWPHDYYWVVPWSALAVTAWLTYQEYRCRSLLA